MIEANQPQELRSPDLKSELNQVTGEFKNSQEILIDQYGESEKLNQKALEENDKLESLITELATIKKEIGAKQEEIRTSLEMAQSLENEIAELRGQIPRAKVLKEIEIRTSLMINDYIELRYQIRRAKILKEIDIRAYLEKIKYLDKKIADIRYFQSFKMKS